MNQMHGTGKHHISCAKQFTILFSFTMICGVGDYDSHYRIGGSTLCHLLLSMALLEGCKCCRMRMGGDNNTTGQIFFNLGIFK